MLLAINLENEKSKKLYKKLIIKSLKIMRRKNMEKLMGGGGVSLAKI